MDKTRQNLDTDELKNMVNIHSYYTREESTRSSDYNPLEEIVQGNDKQKL